MDRFAPDVPLWQIFRHQSRVLLLALAVLWVTAPSTFSQLTHEQLDEISHRFGAQGQAIEVIEKLGGKVAYDQSSPPYQVVAVDLSNSKVADSDMAALSKSLKKLPELKSLDLSNTGLTDGGCGHLYGLTELSLLKVAGTKITETGLAELRKKLRARISLRPRDAKFFPDGAIDPGGDDFLAQWYSEDLFAMGEPSLWKLAREDPKAVALRFTWLPSFRHPLAIRVIPNAEGATLDAVRLDATSGYLGGKPVDRRTVKLSREQWAELKHLVDDAKFWSLPTEMWTNGIADGASYVFEGVDKGKYHVVNANTNPEPDDRYRRYKVLCEAMLKLSGIKVKEF